MARLLPLLPILTLLGACEPSSYWDGVPVAQKLETVEHVEEVTIGFDAVTRQAATADRIVLAETIRRGQVFGSISLEVLTAPVVDPAIGASLSRLIAMQGIPTDRIRLRNAPDLASTMAMVRVYAIQVRTPVCAGLPSASTTDTTALDKRHYVLGCATAANLANMLVDPRDLSAAPAMGAMDAERTLRPIETLRTRSAGKTQQSGGASDSGGGASESGGAGSSSQQ